MSLVWECPIQHCDVMLQTTCRAVSKTLCNYNVSHDFCPMYRLCSAPWLIY